MQRIPTRGSKRFNAVQEWPGSPAGTHPSPTCTATSHQSDARKSKRSCRKKVWDGLGWWRLVSLFHGASRVMCETKYVAMQAEPRRVVRRVGNHVTFQPQNQLHRSVQFPGRLPGLGLPKPYKRFVATMEHLSIASPKGAPLLPL